jgi:hypothetical protein
LVITEVTKKLAASIFRAVQDVLLEIPEELNHHKRCENLKSCKIFATRLAAMVNQHHLQIQK